MGGFDPYPNFLNLTYYDFRFVYSNNPLAHMQLGRSELIKTLEAGAFALTLILLALAQTPAASSSFGLLADTMSLSSPR